MPTVIQHRYMRREKGDIMKAKGNHRLSVRWELTDVSVFLLYKKLIAWQKSNILMCNINGKSIGITKGWG